MMKEAVLLESTISEYNSAIEPSSRKAAQRGRTDRLVKVLSRKHDWTEEGARAIVDLANDYGSFMLRNALALAVLLNKEDGDLGF